MKTVILVWKHKYSNYDTDMYNNYHGVGDLLRATYALYILSKLFKFNLIVDYSLHPISEYLTLNKHDFSDLVKQNSDNIPLIVNSTNIMEYIERATTPQIILSCGIELEFYSMEFHTDIIEETKVFMKTLLIPNENFQKYIDCALEQLPFKEYSVLHYRLGDDELVRGIQNKNFSLILDDLKKDLKDSQILLSDSAEFKDYVNKQGINIFMLNHPICHLGVAKDSISIRNTLLELIILQKASRIKSTSIYSWVSGFTFAISAIYGIPLNSRTNFTCRV
jgi:hypothetical protein